MPTITIFTPTYNRAHCLHKVYESLKRQTCQDFLWLIIDDGSTDDTQALVEGWQKENDLFQIQYFRKENGGLHTGYNEAIRLAQTELMVCIDSDDYMPDDAVEKILKLWSEKGDSSLAGIVGLDISEDGTMIGGPLPQQETINLIGLLTNWYPVKNGDRKLVIRSDLYKKYAPMPSFGSEKNFNPHYMHLQISTAYDMLVLNEPLCVVEYQETGMSRNIFKQYVDSPQSFAQTRRLYMTLPGVSKTFIFKQCIHYVSSCIIAKRYRDILSKTPRKMMTFLAIPFGLILTIYIRAKVDDKETKA